MREPLTHAPLVFDALYKNHDEEYLDAKFLEKILTPQGHRWDQSN